MAILYSLVARGKVVLAEYTSTSGNFPTVVRFMLSVRWLGLGWGVWGEMSCHVGY